MRSILVLALLLLPAAAPASVACEDEVQAARRFWEAKKQATARDQEHIERLQVEVATTRLACLREKCTRRDASACSDVAGVLATLGHAAESRALREKACELGHTESCAAIAPPPSTPAELEARMQQRCTKGDLEGCTDLGAARYRAGNLGAAEDLFRRACDGGLARGCANLALVVKRSGSPADAQRLMSRACEAGFERACRRGLAALDEPF